MNRRQFLTGSTAIVAAAALPLDIAPQSLMEAYGGAPVPAEWVQAVYGGRLFWVDPVKPWVINFEPLTALKTKI